LSVTEIRNAQREGARLIVGFAGRSGSGKTRTAIEFGYVLANYDPQKLGFLDTENRRGSLYADVLQTNSIRPTDKPFLVGDLYPPFSPSRYIEAIMEFQKAGVEVLIVDSGTHEWEGQGGCIEIAEAGSSKMPNWNLAKAAHKRFTNALLACDMHIIFCVRAREKAAPERDDKGKLVYRELGMQPITEKNMMFEMTASLIVDNQGLTQVGIKVPGQLQPYLGRGTGYITAADGKAVRDWVDGAKQLDPAIEKFRNRLLSNTEQGYAHIKDCWDKTPAGVRDGLGIGFRDQLFAAARGHDEQRAEAAKAVAEVGSGRPSDDGTGDAIMAAVKAEVVEIRAEPVAEPRNPDPAPVTPKQTPRAATPAAKPPVAPVVTPDEAIF